MLKRSLATILVLGALSSTAFAGDRCSVPEAERQPQEALQAKLEGEGWKVKKIKFNSGCYEVYGTDAAGKRHETFFDPKTFEAVGED